MKRPQRKKRNYEQGGGERKGKGKGEGRGQVGRMQGKQKKLIVGGQGM